VETEAGMTQSHQFGREEAGQVGAQVDAVNLPNAWFYLGAGLAGRHALQPASQFTDAAHPVGLTQAAVGLTDTLQPGRASVMHYGSAGHGKGQGGTETFQVGLSLLDSITRSPCGFTERGTDVGVGGLVGWRCGVRGGLAVVAGSRMSGNTWFARSGCSRLAASTLRFGGRRGIGYMRQEMGQHDLRSYACGKAVTLAHGVKALPFPKL